jgi:hypothetical protein
MKNSLIDHPMEERYVRITSFFGHHSRWSLIREDKDKQLLDFKKTKIWTIGCWTTKSTIMI